jgi:uncharacterized protein with gpF-like domain
VFVAASSRVADGETNVRGLLDEHKEKMSKVITQLCDDCATRFMYAPFRGVKANAEDYVQLVSTDDVIDAVREQGLRRVVGISETTIEQAQAIIENGLAQGLTNAAIAKALKDSSAMFTLQGRSDTIARTEIHSAVNTAEYEAVESSGVELKREWISTNDDRVRDDHASADGQIVEHDETFTVGGEELRYPGDPGGSPENIINCRCVVGYVRDD